MSPPPSPHFRKTTRLNESGRSIAVTLTHSLAPCLFELRASVTLLIFAAFSEERTRNKWGAASELMTWAGSGSGRPSYVRRVLSRVGMHDAVFLKVDQDQRCVRAVLLLETITHVFPCPLGRRGKTGGLFSELHLPLIRITYHTHQI